MDLFISYSRDDKAWVAELWRALRDEDHDAWMDRFIVPASDWWESILEQVENCECFIYVMTPKAVDSIYCQAELSYAIALNKPILPLMLKTCNFPDYLRQKRVHFQTINDEMSIDRVLVKIEQGLRKIEGDRRFGKYEPQSANRPDEPKASIDAIEALLIAEDAIAIHNYERAISLLKEVSTHAKGVMSIIAHERLTEIQQLSHCGQEYAQIKRLMGNQLLAQRAWQVYQQTECASYDPDNLAVQFSGISLSADLHKAIITTKPRSISSKVYSILPAPFEWLEIPAGKVTLINTDDEDPEVSLKLNQSYEAFVPSFQITKYPVTNAQYAKFIEAGGYEHQEWWTKDGWRIKENKKWTEPRYWQDKKWNGVEYPVVGISWFEAVAFCLWLSKASNEKIILPGERQWQRAAQGDDRRTYPWGDEWDGSRCNHFSSGIKKTSSVHQYEGKGDSPFGVVDMSGNIWEWCRTDYLSTRNNIMMVSSSRVLRGAAWQLDNPKHFRCDDRAESNPSYRFDFVGFRIIRS